MTLVDARDEPISPAAYRELYRLYGDRRRRFEDAAVLRELLREAVESLDPTTSIDPLERELLRAAARWHDTPDQQADRRATLRTALVEHELAHHGPYRANNSLTSRFGHPTRAPHVTHLRRTA